MDCGKGGKAMKRYNMLVLYDGPSEYQVGIEKVRNYKGKYVEWEDVKDLVFENDNLWAMVDGGTIKDDAELSRSVITPEDVKKNMCNCEDQARGGSPLTGKHAWICPKHGYKKL